MPDEAIEGHPFNADLRTVKLEIPYKGQEFERFAHFTTSREQVLGTSEWLATYQALAASELGELTVADAHIAALPHVEDHPTLARKPTQVQIAGSWSVRFHGRGYHANHVHPLGWMSAALYITVPLARPGDPQAGWLVLGQPPDEVGVTLNRIAIVEPRP